MTVPLNMNEAAQFVGVSIDDLVANDNETMIWPLSVQEVLGHVCERFGVSRNALLSGRRDKQVVPARHVAYWLCRELTTASLPEIGRHIGNRDHTTILHGCRNVDGWIADGRPWGKAAVVLRSRLVAGVG